MIRQEKIRLTWIVNIAVVCLGFGIIMPAMRIDPGDGTLQRFITAFLTPGPSTYSIVSSVWALIKTGATMDILLGIIIFLFSVVFPLLAQAFCADLLAPVSEVYETEKTRILDA